MNQQVSTEKFIKVQSVQSGSFSESNNNVDFVIPQGTYDLSESYIALTILPNIQPFQAGALAVSQATVPYLISSEGLGGIQSGYNGMFIRNASLVSDRVGRLEDIRNTNMIHYKLYQLTTSFEEKMKYNYLSTSPMPSSNDIVQPQFLKLPKVGTGNFADFSEPYEIQIGVKEFLRLGEMKQFNTAKMGDLRLRTELDLAKIRLNALGTAASVITADQFFGGLANRQMANIPQNTANNASVTTTQPLGVNLSRSPYYVGQAIRVTATGAGGAADIDVNTTINSIVVNANTTLTLTFIDEISNTAAGETYTGVLLESIDPPADYFDGFEISTAEMRLKKVADVPMDELTYLTITNESDNGGGTASYRNQYYLEPECVGFTMINTQTAVSIVDPFPLNLQSYRIVVDNVDVLGNRDVLVSGPLEHELTQKTLLNLGLPYKRSVPSLTATGTSFRGNVGLRPDNPAIFIGSPTPQTQNRKNLDITLEASAGRNIGHLELFKFVLKSVSF